MKPLQRVVWTEGMFMTPQHLQQLDLYHEALVEARVGALQPYSWGVISMEIDTEALAAGQFQLTRFSGVLPDGLPISFERGQQEAPPARPVDEHLKPTQRLLEVYLGVPKEREGVDSYSQGSTPSRTARFTPASRPVADLLSSSSTVEVSFAQRNVMVLFGSESREDFEALKIAEVVRDKSGALRLQESYIPPCLRVDASPFILDGLRGLLRLMMAKQRDLASTRRHRDASTLEFTAADVTRFLQLNTLNSVIPVINHVLDAGDLSPREVYLFLVQCAGQLYSFAPQGDPSGLPKFQFTNLRTTFEELLARFVELLRGVALEQCISVSLESRRDGLYMAKLEDERLARCSAFVLTVRSDLAEKMVADQLPKRAKVGSWDEIQSLVQSAMPGVPLQVTFRPPPEIPVRPGVVYFTLSIQDPHWKTIIRERTLAIYIPQPFDPEHTQIDLLAVPPSGK